MRVAEQFDSREHSERNRTGISAAEMKELDRQTIEEAGIPSLVLMERAALAVCSFMKDQYFQSPILCVCGAGNNGGDGVAVARLLHLQGKESTVLFIGERDKCSEETKRQWHTAEYYGVPIAEDLSALDGFYQGTVVDALFGVGLSRPLSGIFKDAVERINALPRTVQRLAVDIPSGISADTGEILGAAVVADRTVTFACSKKGHRIDPGKSLSGHIEVVDIGIYATTSGTP